MASSGARIIGLRDTVKALEQVGVEVDDLKDAMAGVAAEGARLASSFVPKASGRLAASIRGNRAKGKAVVTAGRAFVPYAGAVNYGWPRRNMAGSFFLQRADTQLEPRAVALLEAGINEAIRKAGLE